MNEITRIAVDTSKSVFTLHGIDERGRPVVRRNLRRVKQAGHTRAIARDQKNLAKTLLTAISMT